MRWTSLQGRLLAAACLLLSAVLLPDPAPAQDGGLSPTLANIKATHTVRLGYREASPPFSFMDQSNRPIGYSLELCQAIVDEIGVEVDDPALRIEYVLVTPETRIPAILNNKIDLAPHVGASLEVMERDAKRMRGTRPFVFTNLRAGEGVGEIARFVEDKGGLAVGRNA